MGNIRWLGAAVLGLALFLTTGCENHAQEDRARLAKIEADGEALNHALDDVETRLLAAQSRVALWSELKERHQHVSAIAIQNQGTHMEAMVKFIARQQARSRSNHARLASADPFAFGEGGKPRRRTHLRHEK